MQSEHTLPTVAQRNLPSTSRLTESSYCPTRDLVALISQGSTSSTTNAASSGSSSAQNAGNKLTLWRTTGNADLVWEWTPPPSRVATVIATPPVGRLGGLAALKGKGKADTSTIQQIVWHPKGQYLAAIVTCSLPAPPGMTQDATFVHILTIDAATSPLPPFPLPSSSSGQISFFSWQSLNLPTDPLLQSHAVQLIQSLPPLPPLTKDSATKLGTVLGGSGIGSAAITPQGGVFGAKNAMLQREREKEMGRPVQLQLAGKRFPSLLNVSNTADTLSANTSSTGSSAEQTSSILLIGTDSGEIEFYLEACLHLGTINCAPGQRIMSIDVQHSPLQANSLSVLLETVSENESKISSESCSLGFPPSLPVFAAACTQLRNLISHAFEALQESRNLWDESRRIGKAWLARLAELSKSHSGQSKKSLRPSTADQPKLTPFFVVNFEPTSQLLQLLMTGRARPSLHDFLASKMNEKALQKWETATKTAFESIKLCTFTSLEPSIERSILLLDEMKAWAQWPQKFEVFKLETEFLSNCIEICKQIIRCSAQLEKKCIEEEREFEYFKNWLHYEVERIALDETSETHPLAHFQPIPAAHFIRYGLAQSTLSAYLDFGLATVSLENNQQLDKVNLWWNLLQQHEIENGATSREQSLNFLLSQIKMNKSPETRDKESKSSFSPPISIPALLHFLAKRVSNALADSLNNLSLTNPRQDEFLLHQYETQSTGSDTETESTPIRAVSIQSAEANYHAWSAGPEFFVSKQTAMGVQMSRNRLVTADRTRLELIDYISNNESEFILLVRSIDRLKSDYFLARVKINQLQFESNFPPSAPKNALPFTRIHDFDRNYPPERLALKAGQAKNFICLIAAEGRRLEVLELTEI